MLISSRTFDAKQSRLYRQGQNRGLSPCRAAAWSTCKTTRQVGKNNSRRSRTRRSQSRLWSRRALWPKCRRSWSIDATRSAGCTPAIVARCLVWARRISQSGVGQRRLWSSIVVHLVRWATQNRLTVGRLAGLLAQENQPKPGAGPCGVQSRRRARTAATYTGTAAL